MKIDRFEVTKTFEKSYRKLRKGEQERVKSTLAAASVDVYSPALRFHELKGAKAGVLSVNAGGDLRILFRLTGDTEVVALLLVVGTHSQLYS